MCMIVRNLPKIGRNLPELYALTPSARRTAYDRVLHRGLRSYAVRRPAAPASSVSPNDNVIVVTADWRCRTLGNAGSECSKIASAKIK
jgi:hypothetical protein